MLTYTLIVYLLIVNIVAFGAMWWDKRKAERGARRTREKTLLTFGAAGGVWGMLVGMRKFRHKTRDTKFRIGAFLVLLLNVFAYYLLWTFVL